MRDWLIKIGKGWSVDKAILIIFVTGDGKFFFRRVQNSLNKLEFNDLFVAFGMNRFLNLSETPNYHHAQMPQHNQILVSCGELLFATAQCDWFVHPREHLPESAG